MNTVHHRQHVPFNGEAVGIIPARSASTRFPNKPLSLIHGIPMVCWTHKRASQALSLREVFVAAEDEQIVEAVKKRGGNAKLIQGRFRSGSDRVAEAVRELNPQAGIPAIVNIQADEPLIEPSVIDDALAMLESRPEFDITTAVRPIRSLEEYLDPNCVKVVLDADGRCLYFSRAPIPDRGKKSPDPGLPSGIPFRRHVGIYCFRPAVLQRFTQLPKSPLEECEELEQLRWLEAGGTIGAVETSASAPSVDMAEDLLLAERYIIDHGIEYA